MKQSLLKLRTIKNSAATAALIIVLAFPFSINPAKAQSDGDACALASGSTTYVRGSDDHTALICDGANWNEWAHIKNNGSVFVNDFTATNSCTGCNNGAPKVPINVGTSGSLFTYNTQLFWSINNEDTMLGYEAGENTTGGTFRNVCIGYQACKTTSGTNNTNSVHIGYQTGTKTNQATGNNVQIGSLTGTLQNQRRAVMIGYNITENTNTNNHVIFGSNISSSGFGAGIAYLNVGGAIYGDPGINFNPTSADAAITFDGDVEAVSYATSSDARLKKIVSSLDPAQSLIKTVALNGVYFNWKEKVVDPERQVGFIAQNVQQSFPNVITDSTLTDKNGKPYLTIDELQLTAPAVASIQKLDEQQKTISDRLSRLEKLAGETP